MALYNDFRNALSKADHAGILQKITHFVEIVCRCERAIFKVISPEQWSNRAMHKDSTRISIWISPDNDGFPASHSKRRSPTFDIEWSSYGICRGDFVQRSIHLFSGSSILVPLFLSLLTPCPSGSSIEGGLNCRKGARGAERDAWETLSQIGNHPVSHKGDASPPVHISSSFSRS
jgi:hypothetical protein